MSSSFSRIVVRALLAIVLLASFALAQSTQPGSYSESSGYVPRSFSDGKKSSKGKKSGNPPQSSIVASPDRELTVSVAVWDSNGKFVRDLKQSDFEILVDDKPVRLEGVETTGQPVQIVVVVDVSPSADSANKLLREQAIDFLQNLRPTDQAMVVAFAEKNKILSEFADSREKAIEALKKLGEQDGTSLYNTIGDLFSKTLTGPSPRTAVVLMTDGVDTTSKRYDYLSSLAAVEGSEAVVFPVYLDTSTFNTRPTVNVPGIGSIVIPRQNLPDMKKEYERGRLYLTDMLTLSGGRPIAIANLKSDFAQMNSIPEELRARYYLKFTVVQTGPVGTRHSLRVRVLRPGLAVLAKGSYLEQ